LAATFKRLELTTKIEEQNRGVKKTKTERNPERKPWTTYSSGRATGVNLACNLEFNSGKKKQPVPTDQPGEKGDEHEKET